MGVNPCKMCCLLMIAPSKVTSGAGNHAQSRAWMVPVLICDILIPFLLCHLDLKTYCPLQTPGSDWGWEMLKSIPVSLSIMELEAL